MAAQVALRRQTNRRLLVENTEAEPCEVETTTATEHGTSSPSTGGRLFRVINF